MRVIYFNPDVRLYLVAGDVRPVLLANADDFDNDSFDEQDPVEVVLSRLGPEHYVVCPVGRHTYVARRDGVTISFAQVLYLDDYTHSDSTLAEALDVVIAYERS
jgi:hypothetical protein